MKTKLMYIAVVLAMLASLVPAIMPASDVGAVLSPTFTVGAGKMYATIQAAIDNASAGYTIVVYDGTYNERLTINKSLTVRSDKGPSTTHINGSLDETGTAVVLINGSHVTFGGNSKGFDIWGCEAGVVVKPTENESAITAVTVQGNMVHDVDYGILAIAMMENTSVSNSNIVDNTISYTDQGIILSALKTEGGTDGDISDNHVTGNTIYQLDSVGIFLGASPEGPSEIGVLSGNVIEGNSISYCDEGIEVINYDTDSAPLPGSIYGNSITGNTIYECNPELPPCGIDLINNAGNMSDNDVTGNTVYNCSDGIYLENNGDYMVGSDVTGNTVYGCGNGIELHNDGNDMFNNTIDGNTVYNCYSDGIRLYNDGDDMFNNTIDDNTVYNCHNGIEQYNDYGFALYENNMNGNTVYDCYYGIYMENYDGYTLADAVISNTTTWHGSPKVGNDYGIYLDDCYNISVYGNDISYNDETGLYIEDSEEIDVKLNTVHNNSEGIGIYDCSDIYIYGNDIRYNIGTEPGTGIHAYSFCDVDVICNNIVGNVPGIDADYACDPLYAPSNWWGDPSGPSGEGYSGTGDEVECYVNVDNDWLEEELSFELSVETAAVPNMISVYDMLWPTDVQELYSLGPSYADLIVDVTGLGCVDCADPDVTYNLSALLLDMLPANFNNSYVSNWGSELQEDWQEWLDYLGNTDAGSPYSYGNVSLADYELQLGNIFFGDTSSEDPSCFTLQKFFWEAYGENSSAMLNDLIFTKLRHGTFQVPVTITTAYEITITDTVPLTIVDFQLPLERGWNLRSAPISLDAGFNTWGAIKNLGDGMPGFEAALTYSASTGWAEPASGTVLTPLNAYYIKLSDSDNMGFVVNRGSSDAVSRTLYAGWNLVGASSNFTYNESLDDAYPFPVMLVQDALASVAGTESAQGWVIAEAIPSNIDFIQYFSYKDIALEKAGYDTFFYQWPWTMTYDNRWGESDRCVTPGGGYWVFMENRGTLEDANYTPLPADSIPMTTPTPTPTSTPTP